LPKRVTLVDWVEDVDLRLLRRQAPRLARRFKLEVGETLLITGLSRHKGEPLHRFLIQTAHGPYVWAPPTSGRDLMTSMMLRVSEHLQKLRDVSE
jgi:hypothetical protein